MYTSKETSATRLLQEHAKRFKKRIEKVTDGVYSAIGYGLANSILLVTDEGNIIVDTTESITAAEEIKKEFNRISPQKTIAIIYTHGHTDHVRGASVFMDEGTEVYAHRKTTEFFYEQFNQLEPILTLRGARQFGIKISEEYVPTSGLGPLLRMDGKKPKIVMPTKSFDTTLDLTIGNLDLQLVSAPGETEDQIFIWLPKKKVLLSADNYYPCFPNLYTIRGTPPRPVFQWIESLDKMRYLHASYLVPSHAEPIYGEEKVFELLTVYRDAIQYVHDAVVRGMNQGKTPDDLVDEIMLPASLLQYEQLSELYGDVSQSVRSIFDSYLGWFDGNATNLVPMSKKEKSWKYVELMGGFDKVLSAISEAFLAKEYQLITELCDLLLGICPGNQDILYYKSEALFELGIHSSNSNNRSYYITQAMELRNEIVMPKRTKEVHYAFSKSMSIEQFFMKMMILLDSKKAEKESMNLQIHLTDKNTSYELCIRRGILDVQKLHVSNDERAITVNEDTWKKLVLNIEDIANVESDIHLSHENKQKLSSFLQFFDV